MNAEDLFARHFLPLYPPDAGADLARARATDANPAKNQAVLAHLDDAAERFARNGLSLFGGDLGLDRSDGSVHRLSAALTRDRRDAWARAGAPGSAESALFNVVVHGAAYVGACVVANHAGCWSVRRPLWESVVRLRSPAGEGDLPVFHWWIKSLSDAAFDARDGAGASLADRYRAHVEIPCLRAHELPVFVHHERPLPRLSRPSYARLHQYIRAHLPEIRDLGGTFPSPERFAAFAFRWMDFYVVGGGRRVILAGASPNGLHLFWLAECGFEKSAFVAGDAGVEPVVGAQGDRIVATIARAGVSQEHEMFWWGL